VQKQLYIDSQLHSQTWKLKFYRKIVLVDVGIDSLYLSKRRPEKEEQDAAERLVQLAKKNIRDAEGVATGNYGQAARNWATVDQLDYTHAFTNKFLYVVSYNLNFNVRF
jgi:hypothetical protein